MTTFWHCIRYLDYSNSNTFLELMLSVSYYYRKVCNLLFHPETNETSKSSEEEGCHTGMYAERSDTKRKMV